MAFCRKASEAKIVSKPRAGEVVIQTVCIWREERSVIAAILSMVLAVAPSDQLPGHVDVDLLPLYFPAGRPGAAESGVDLETLVDPTTEYMLQAVVDFLAENYVVGVNVVGFADVHECKSVGCDRLAMRRARAVFAWLVAHGVRREQLHGPASGSTNYPVNEAITEEEQARNRQVAFQIFVVGK